MSRPVSTAYGRALRALSRQDLFVPRTQTATAKHRAFASIGPLLWNGLPSLTRPTILSVGISLSGRSLKTFHFRGVLRTLCASDYAIF